MPEPLTPLLSRKSVLGGTEETTSGTAATVTAALANTTIYDAKMEPLDMHADGARLPIGNSLGAIDSVLAKQTGRLTFKQELRYGDQFLPLLTGAGFKLTTATYAPTSDMTARKTWTFKLWEDGRVKSIYGAAGNFTLTATTSGRVMVDWEWTGIWAAVADDTLPTLDPDVHTATLYFARGATLTVGAAATPLVSTVTVAPGNTIAERMDIVAATGIRHFYVASRLPKVTLDTEARTVANGAPFAAMLAGTEAALAFALSDGTHTLTIAAPCAQKISPVGDGERNGLRVDNVTLQCNIDEADDELTFTAA